MSDIACWITFFADGARRSSSRWVLYSRFGDAGFLCADGMIILLRDLYGKPPCLATIGLEPRLIDARFVAIDVVLVLFYIGLLSGFKRF